MARRLVMMAGALVLAGSCAAFAQSAGVSPKNAAEKQVIDTENAWAAAFQGCKTDAIDKLMTADFTITGFNGISYSRAWFMDTVKACEHDTIRIEPLLVRVYGDHAAIVISKFHQFINKKPAPLFDLTQVLVKENGTWKVALHHSTRIDEKSGPQVGKLFPGLKGGESQLK